MPRRRGDRDWYYDRFAEDEEETEDEAFESIASDVDRIWRSKWWSKNIRDDESQWGLITAMQKKYIDPDYLDLVGPPGPEDYRAEGHLTTSRKAELLLIGTFNYRYWADLWGQCKNTKNGVRLDFFHSVTDLVGGNRG